LTVAHVAVYHVGSIFMLFLSRPLPHRARRALENHARWVDEVDAATDRELARLPGVGPKAISAVRQALDVYYWRGDESASRQLWEKISRRLQDSLDYPYLERQDRELVIAGLAFAARVLRENGGPLRDDPSAARKAHGLRVAPVCEAVAR
jgi:hypothetical protein